MRLTVLVRSLLASYVGALLVLLFLTCPFLWPRSSAEWAFFDWLELDVLELLELMVVSLSALGTSFVLAPYSRCGRCSSDLRLFDDTSDVSR